MSDKHPNNLTHLHGLTWEQWRDQLEDHHEHLRATEAGFEGYGPKPIMTQTGDECWKQYWIDGFSPQEALAEDRDYWEW